jgi:hypothetical protein
MAVPGLATGAAKVLALRTAVTAMKYEVKRMMFDDF